VVASIADTATSGIGKPQQYSLLLVLAGQHIEVAAFGVEQSERAKEELGPLQVFLGYSPSKISLRPPPGSEAKYATSYYWQKQLELPQFVEFAKPGPLFYLTTRLKAAWSATIILFLSFWALIAKTSRVAFFERMKHQALQDIPIGAPVLSDYLRNEQHSHGYLRIDRGFLETLYLCHLYAHYWLRVCPDLDFSTLLFSLPETTYRYEIVRRVLLRRGAAELFSDRWNDGDLRISASHREGIDTMLCSPRRHTLSVEESREVREALRRRLDGLATYVHLGFDVDATLKPFFSRTADQEQALQKPQALVFMHGVSDAQHFYGPDCFVDLDHWLHTSLALLLAKGFSVYLKSHPSLHTQAGVSIELRYKRYVEKRLKVSWDDLAPGEIRKTAIDDVYIVDGKLGLQVLHAFLGLLLCVTHHGTIATEAIALRIPVVCSVANPFQRFPAFASTYTSFAEYAELLTMYIDGHLEVTEVELRNLYLYVYENQRDYWLWSYEEYTRWSGRNFLREPSAFVDFLLSVNSWSDQTQYEQVRKVFGGRKASSPRIREVDCVRRLHGQARLS
jgi:hypothetical protein